MRYQNKTKETRYELVGHNELATHRQHTIQQTIEELDKQTMRPKTRMESNSFNIMIEFKSRNNK
jgi:hypothetical protein